MNRENFCKADLALRIPVMLLGIAVMCVSLVLLPAALLAIPQSWLGFLWIGYGICCCVAGFVCFTKRKWWLLVFMLPGVVGTAKMVWLAP